MNKTHGIILPKPVCFLYTLSSIWNKLFTRTVKCNICHMEFFIHSVMYTFCLCKWNNIVRVFLIIIGECYGIDFYFPLSKEEKKLRRKHIRCTQSRKKNKFKQFIDYNPDWINTQISWKIICCSALNVCSSSENRFERPILCKYFHVFRTIECNSKQICII